MEKSKTKQIPIKIYDYLKEIATDRNPPLDKRVEDLREMMRDYLLSKAK